MDRVNKQVLAQLLGEGAAHQNVKAGKARMASPKGASRIPAKETQMPGIEEQILAQMGPDANMAQDPAAMLEALLAGNISLQDLPFESAHPLEGNDPHPLFDEAYAMMEERNGTPQMGDGDIMQIEAIARLLEMMQGNEQKFDQRTR